MEKNTHHQRLLLTSEMMDLHLFSYLHITETMIHHHHRKTSIIRRQVTVTFPNNLQIELSILQWSIMNTSNRKGITPIALISHRSVTTTNINRALPLVQLIPYNPNVLDESVLWTESKDLGDGYRTMRMVNNIHLNVNAFNGDKNHGGCCGVPGMEAQLRSIWKTSYNMLMYSS
ncbi:hypothetical protein RHSIM_Rhsim03G0000300 [Rhododendron simsii]|uniref:Uncharacterized protein n=1 Tax=Rhododendron simsii TaxID=118357 RepID=A0A834H344_RHOSS|nr:hypothetical protein RHSIM_Rhsim03G0000300 [Rhododendron simsii]